MPFQQSSPARKRCLFSVAIALFCIQFLDGVEVWAQPSTARELFLQASTEKNIRKRIELYNLALAQDDGFVDAWYNLGIAYRDANDIPQAIATFRRALTVEAVNRQRQVRSRILYELGLLQEKAKSPGEAMATLQQGLQEAPAASYTALFAYELGRLYLQDEKFDQAEAMFKTALTADPNNTRIYRQALELVAKRAGLDSLYREGRAELEKRNFRKAAGLFEELVKIGPYRDTKQLLEQANLMLAQEERQQKKDGLYRQGLDLIANKKWAEATVVLKELVESDSAYADAARQLQFAESQQSESEKSAAAEELCKQGEQALRAGKWASALTAFERAKRLLPTPKGRSPDYDRIDAKIEQAKHGLRKSELEKQIQEFYAEGAAALAKGNYPAAIAALSQVVQYDPNYGEVKKLLEKARDENESVQRLSANPQLEQRLNNEIDTTQQTPAVVAALVQPKVVEPSLETSATKTGSSIAISSVMMGGIGLVIFLLFTTLASWIVLSKPARARFYLLQGNYEKAEVVYKQLMAAHPATGRRYYEWDILSQACRLLSESKSHES